MSHQQSLLLQKVQIRFARPRVDDVAAAVRAELTRHRGLFASGARIGLAVGSRGVANIATVVRTAVDMLHGWGVKPFVLPAMGSHGGATAEGQRALLADYGISEDRVGCPVHSSMDVVELDRGPLPHGLFMDRYAFESDGVLLINRVKPHTDFHGRYESGLVKMAVIGLGKERQALAIHHFGAPGLRDGIPEAARQVLATGKIIAGLALIENAYDETMRAELVPADDIMTREPELLEIARQNMPALVVDSLDVLIVDRIGKDVSGTGLDTNAIGRMRIHGEAEPERPRIRMIVATDLTDASHGNATGLGLTDVITRRLFDKIDIGVTYTNTFTSGFIERGKIPLVAPTDAAAVACALRARGVVPAGSERIGRIRDTLHLDEVYLSPAACRDLLGRADVVVDPDLTPMFDVNGTLRPF